MSHFPGFFVQSHDVLDVETIYLFSCVNILSEIIEEFLRLDLMEQMKKPERSRNYTTENKVKILPSKLLSSGCDLGFLQIIRT